MEKQNNQNNSTINDKKKSKNNNPPDYKSFYKNLLFIVINIFISISLSCIFIYICKLSQSNVLIDKLEYVPFSDDKNNIKIPEKIPIDVNIIKLYKGIFGKIGLGWLFGEEPEKVYSTKVEFENYKENPNVYNLFEKLKKMAYGKHKEPVFEKRKDGTEFEKPQGTGIMYYIYNVISSSVVSNLWILNMVFNFLNENLSESILLLIFYFFTYIIILGLVIVNFGITFFNLIYYSPYIYYSRFPQGKNPPIFSFDGGNIIKIFTSSNIFAGFMLFFGFLVALCISIFNLIYSFVICLSQNGTILNSNLNSTKQKFNYLYILKSVFQYKSQIIILLFIYGLFNDIYKNFGIKYIISFVIAMIIIYFFTNILKSYDLNSSDTMFTEKIGKFTQAKVKSFGGSEMKNTIQTQTINSTPSQDLGSSKSSTSSKTQQSSVSQKKEPLQASSTSKSLSSSGTPNKIKEIKDYI